MRKENQRYICYAVIGAIVLFGSEAPAQNISVDPQDAGFWYRTIVAALLALLIWIAKGADSRLKDAEKAIGKFSEMAGERGNRLDNLRDRLTLLEHEHKNTISLISAQRELLLTRYHDKEDTEVHRQKLEDALEKQQYQLAKVTETLQTICHRLDHFVRPSHRSQDDKEKYLAADAHR